MLLACRARTTVLPSVLATSLVAVFALSGCSTSVTGVASKAATSRAATSKAATSAAATSATPTPTKAAGLAGSITDGASLGALIESGLKSLTSVHSVTTISVSGQDIVAVTDSALTNAATTASRVDETFAGQAIEILIVGTDAYAKLPPAIIKTTAKKPWVRLTATSKNPLVKQMAGALTSATTSGVDTAGIYSKAASRVAVIGPDPVDGVPATHITATIDVSKLPPGLSSTLLAVGVTTFDSDFWIGDGARVLKTTQSLTVSGKVTATSTVFSAFNAPVSITAPTANQITPS